MTSFVAALFLLALAGPALATPPKSVEEITNCIHDRVDEHTAPFKGNVSCPAVCAHCHEAPPASTCPALCKKAKIFCGCAGLMFEALEASKTCCVGLSGLLLLACSAGTEELREMATQIYGQHCLAGAVKMTGQVNFPNLADLAGKASFLQQGAMSSSSAVVIAHRMGADCVSMLEGLEQEHAALAEQQGDLEQVPDLHAAAVQIADRASGLLGAEMPKLKGAVHRAMTQAYSEEGPGMDSHDVCQLILDHHDAL
uniref:Uncharacterized protein n=1 Tax=Alexandrium catenella TaxID=2925 RepID=A0A7S1WG93_ALECA